MPRPRDVGRVERVERVEHRRMRLRGHRSDQVGVSGRSLGPARTLERFEGFGVHRVSP
jgi:hypothetical protein